MSTEQNLAAIFKNWLTATNTYSQPTIETYFQVIKNFFNYLNSFKRYHLNNVDLDFLRQFIHQKQDKTPYALASVKLRVAAMDIFFSWAHENGFCRQNTLVAYKKSRIYHKPPSENISEQPGSVITLLSPNQQQWILDQTITNSFTEIRTRCLVTLILACALYAEEITTLLLTDFHLSAGYLEIKGDGKRERKVIFDKSFYYAACQDWLKLRKQIPSVHKQPLLFCTQDSKPLSKLMLRRSASNYLEKAGIARKYCTPDTLRQTAIGNMLKNGQSLEEVQTITGIKTLARLELYQKSI